MRVRTTSASRAPACANTRSMFAIACRVWRYASSLPTMCPSPSVAVVPETQIWFPTLTAGEQLVRQRRPVRGHEIGRLHCAQRDRVLVRPAVAHDADRADRQEHGEGLRDLIVPAGATQFLDEDRVRTAQQLCTLARHLAQNAHAQPRAGKWMPKHELARQAQSDPELTYLVLEQLAQRLE